MRSGSTDPIMDTVNCENSAPDDSTGSLAVASTSGVVEYKSEPEPLKGNETTPVYFKTESFSENHDNTTLTDSNIVIQQVEVIRETLTVSNPNEDSEIVNKDGKHSVSIQVDPPLLRFIEGKWGLIQKQIEGETGVKIIFPSAKGDSSIVIEGASVENVNRASEKITNVLEQAVKSPNLDYSHFISLPLAIHPELVEKLHSFQKSVLEEDNMIPGHMDVGIDRSIFVKPQTFHSTVLMLKLWNKDRVAMATKILKEVSSKVMDALENRPVSIRLRGLASMKGSPAKARVIYAPIEKASGDGRLLRACQVIIDAYVEAGLALQNDVRQSLKLHATVMNARHRKRNMWTRRHDFDARGIFKRYGSEDWGEYVIPEAHLSQRFVFDESGYYHCCGSIPFPGAGSIKIE